MDRRWVNTGLVVLYIRIGCNTIVVKNISKKPIKREDSKDSLRAFIWSGKDPKNATILPSFDLKLAEDMVRSDPISQGSLNHFVDKCMEGGYTLLKRDTKKVSSDEKERLEEEYQFRKQIIEKSFIIGKLFGNVFIEIVRRTDNTVKSLNILDSANIEPITKPNGDPIKYVSKIPNPVTKKHPEWNTDEVVWLKFYDKSQGWGPVNLEALYQTLLWKQYVRRYVSWLWETGQYRVLYNFSKTRDEDINDFLVYAKRNDENFKAPFVTKGEMQKFMVREIGETDNIVRLLKWLDEQILVLMRIPPIDAGFPDASGRSNADAQSNNLNTHVKNFRKTVEDGINYLLFPKIHKGNTFLKFGPTDRFQLKQVFDTVNIMKNMGMTEKAIKEFMSRQGVYFETDELFEKPEETEPESKAVMEKDIDTMPSRFSPDTKELNKQGTGQNSSTREDQLIKRSLGEKFTGHPYSIEVNQYDT